MQGMAYSICDANFAKWLSFLAALSLMLLLFRLAVAEAVSLEIIGGDDGQFSYRMTMLSNAL